MQCFSYASLNNFSSFSWLKTSSKYFDIPLLTAVHKQLKSTHAPYPKIIEKRVEFDLDDYVPFHFHPYSAFDVIVKNDNPETEFIYITIKREFAAENNFKIIPFHPLSKSNEFEIYDFNLAAIGITTAIKGLEMPLSAGNYGAVNLERSVDIILKIICYGIMKR